MSNTLAPGLRATLRLQFHAGFTLQDALQQVPYFARLGISHLYASPLLTAREGSMHGYDVVDPTQVSPALGGETALRELVKELRAYGMGLILDIVSNHMAVGGHDNPWWLDLLAWGRASPYAEFFDIQWHSSDPLLEGLLLLPYLSDNYGITLKKGDIRLRFNAEKGTFYAEHGNHHFPICPLNYPALLNNTQEPELLHLANAFAALHTFGNPRDQARPLHRQLSELSQRAQIIQAVEQSLARYDSRHAEGFARLHQLLESQSYRLASWRTAADDINWRRFFDVNELAGLRVERPAVFEATHGKIFELIEQNLIDGLRIDHIDGLANPGGYCRKLRRRIDGLRPDRHVPIYVEKILGIDEQLPADWGVDGTTGYEFMDQVSLLQHAPEGEQPLATLWADYSQRPADFKSEALLARQQILNGALAGDFESVTLTLLDVARNDIMTRDLTLGAIRRALQALVMHFTAYRTYISAAGRSDADEVVFQQALADARQDLNEADWPVLDNLEQWLGGQPWRSLPVGRSRKMLKLACVRFQQLTSPTAAKAVEDTAFYRYGRLLSRNDVGFGTERFSAPIEAFHHACLTRLKNFPDNLLATATHDHKRGEDSRARLAVLSEMSDWYAQCVKRWQPMAQALRKDRIGPTPGDELILYQIILSTWPLDLRPDDAPGLQRYNVRLWQWQLKALRESKLQSQWSAPNEPYESAVETFLEQLLLTSAGLALRTALYDASETIASAGVANGLAQTLLKLTTPGVPDIYQGTELWDLSLVDPDNRRPVDFTQRQRLLDAPPHQQSLLQTWRTGALKQALIAQTLSVRALHPELFSRGSYIPLTVTGEHARHVLAFARQWNNHLAIVVVARLSSHAIQKSVPTIKPGSFGEKTFIELPFDGIALKLKGLFAAPVVTTNRTLRISDALNTLPVALMINT
ncbi:malto-oligosyltrehalose synthase [Pseudomonas helleri]|uniref:malto-oligosyltrehalose synthase n=1 Tax=Pseudomonas helleri TaxID=1608996 RepID=UPI0028E61B4A|nr:malto-oligosyltrehalose synthase [Pseudomonas helleri]